MSAGGGGGGGGEGRAGVVGGGAGDREVYMGRVGAFSYLYGTQILALSFHSGKKHKIVQSTWRSSKYP